MQRKFILENVTGTEQKGTRYIQRWYVSRALVAALAALTLTLPATAAKRVSLSGHSSGVVTPVNFDAVDGIAYTHVTGEGEESHLGHFIVTGDVGVEVATGIPLGNWTLNFGGDLLFLAMGGHGIDPTHGFGAFVVVGGTGRFQAATGYYEQTITFATPPGNSVTSYTDVFEGTISSAALKNRKKD